MLLPNRRKTMRRFWLTLTILVLAGRSQPAPQQAQPLPIAVKVEMPPKNDRDFFGYLQSLGPLIAASVAIGVALVQYGLQRQSQKQDLFDKRFTVFTTVEAYLTAANTGDSES